MTAETTFEIPAITPRRPWAEMTQPARPGVLDRGPALLDQLERALMMDPEWVWLDARTLWWWGGPIPMGFTVDVPRMAFGDPTVKMSAVVHLVEGITADDEVVLEVLAARNRVASSGALVWDQTSRRVMLFLTHYAHDRNDAVTRLFPGLALLAYTEALALFQDGSLARLLKGRPTRSAHPRTGSRQGFDDLIDSTDAHIKPRGRRGNPFRGAAVAGIADHFMQRGLFSMGDSSAVTAEFPWTSPVPAIVAKHMGISAPGRTAMLRLEANKHPGYGQGMVGLLHLPESLSPIVAMRRANELNMAEMCTATGFPAWGAWTASPDRSPRIVHAGFVPNALAIDGLPAAVAQYAYMRSQWAQERLLDPLTVAAVRAGRMG